MAKKRAKKTQRKYNSPRGWNGPELSQDQKDAVKDILTGDGPFFLVGIAGSGKSTVINYLRSTEPGVSVTATTGLAAQLIGGHTLHHFAGIHPEKGVLSSWQANYRVSKTKILVVDEASMMDEELFDKLLERIKEAKAKLKIVLSGDFLQLPPVSSEPFYKSKYWEHFKVIKLTTCHRQKDIEFLDILNDIRCGKKTERVSNFIQAKTVSSLPEDCTHLMSHRDKVEIRNKQKLEEIKGKEFRFEWNLSDYTETPSEANLIKNARMIESLHVKVGARVMLLNNDKDYRWVNGSTGTIVDVREDIDLIYVQLDFGRVVEVNRIIEEITNADGFIVYTIEQYPIMLAFAVTIHKCVSGETLIHTENGIEEIKDVAFGIPENTFIEKPVKILGNNGFNITQQIFHGKKEKSIKILTKQGFEIEGSYRHPILTLNEKYKEEWKTLPELKIGDTVIMKKGMNTSADWFPNFSKDGYNKNTQVLDLEKCKTEEFSWFLGYLIGDGSFSKEKDGRIEITSGDHDVLVLIQKTLKSININSTYDNKSKTHRVYAHSKMLRKYLKEIGMEYVCAWDKTIPKSILKGSLKNQARFISGLFDSDGGCNKNCIHFTTTSEKLSKQVHLLLLNLGIRGSRRVLNKKSKNRKAWRMQICGREATKFIQKIGFLCKRKKEIAFNRFGNFKTKFPKNQVNPIPGSIQEIKEIRNILRKTGQWKKTKSNIKNWLKNIISNKSHLYNDNLEMLISSVPAIKDCGEYGKFLNNIIEKELFFDTIEEITFNECEMYDVYIPNNHTFVGNGFINHNSQGSTLDKVGIDLTGHFAPGQTYVSLSRCRSSEGVFLSGKLDGIKTDMEAVKLFG